MVTLFYYILNMKITYEILKELKAPWLDKFTADVKTLIEERRNAIAKEAKADGIENLTEDFLYSHFKDNCQYDLIFSNWQILKYFAPLMEIKVMEEMIGIISYTEHDKEMFEYFINSEPTQKERCQCKHLKFKTSEPWNYNFSILYYRKNGNGYIQHNKYKLYFEYDTIGDTVSKNRVIESQYTDIFEKHFIAIENMVRKPKCLRVFWSQGVFDLFDFENELRYEPYYVNCFNSGNKEHFRFKRWSPKPIKRIYYDDKTGNILEKLINFSKSLVKKEGV